MNAVNLVRRIAARPSIVFEALTTAEGLSSWFGPDDGQVLSASSDVRVGGKLAVRFRLAGDTIEDVATAGSEHECLCEFLEIDKPRRIVMSWQWIFGGDPAEQGRTSRLEFHLRPIDTGTELTLIHAGLRDEAAVRSHGWGWSGALDKLMRQFPGSSGAGASRQQAQK
jgi:uncharacterized protein YndB with AHSA1/START domain